MNAAAPTDPRNHKAWVAYWGDQLVAAIVDAVAHPEDDNMRLRYAINCARIAYGRAIKARPSLKPKGEYR